MSAGLNAQQSVADSAMVLPDTTSVAKKKMIEGTVTYTAKDSIYIDLKSKNTYLFKNAKMHYLDLDLTAEKISMNFEKQQVSAQEGVDSAGNKIGTPHFKDKTQEFDAKEITYNFDTKRGLIKDIFMQQDEIYVHGNVMKKMEDNVIFVKGAKFTTCDLAEPHFHIGARRAKVIPDDKVVTGGAALYFENIPTPLALPFTLFPNTSRAKSGLVIPAYGETQSQGFYLRGGGWFFAINDYMNFLLTGDIYSLGDWALHGKFDYRKRYKANGVFMFDYSQNQVGEKGTSTYNIINGYKVVWSHNQDQKARPNSSFSANVNYYNSSYSRYSPSSQDYLQNQNNSSISYYVRFGEKFTFTAKAGQSYNVNTRKVDLDLPSFSFNIDPVYPFKNKVRKGPAKWFETINLKYSLEGVNRISAVDSLFFTQETFDNMDNGLQQKIPVSSNITIFRYFNWNNSVSYTGRFYTKTIQRGLDTNFNPVDYDVNGFASSHEFSYSSSISTKLYGMIQLLRFPIRAIRHILTPSIGYSFHPNYSDPEWGYYNNYYDINGIQQNYSIFSRGIYGSPGAGKASNINFNLGNNLEIKVRNKKDSITGTRKISIIDNLNISASYNMAADSLKWSPISISGTSRLFNLITVNYGWEYDLYARDINGNRKNVFVWEENSKWLHRDYSTWALGFGYDFSPKKKQKQASTENITPVEDELEQHISPFYNNMEVLTKAADFSAPWTFGFNYTLNYRNAYVPSWQDSSVRYMKTLVQTLGFRATLELTPKWRLGASSGYDFEQKKLTYTTVDIYRDLHCFEMSFSWIPFGARQSWSFSIRAKAGMLRDAMKYDKRKSFIDNESYR